ncbi:DUF916 and DUF3324 domain-containing protein [Apilactobacillus micheneri]|uniref:DUF916 and DUF3324 domain-containing protein n=1 Tax=Apilactobacillus micheneri TaxID=1899430 RepID=UPI00112C0CD6|nr:DUF916 and DUF3324 domain-containing protein [Apilactobacillus micheneri]TPR43926.1 DUF916 and DUF3324 domain-containing protein [Apilactobacillus micheneri]TPR47698.1 DUF916 and DUF3324 domain-containing protein [Apilactobacillus micheneri]
MKIIKNIIIGFTLCFSFLFLFTISTYDANAAGVNFSVNPVFSSGQAKNQSSYFDLNVKPGQTYPLKVRVNNAGDENTTIKASVNTAFTNDNTEINYGENNLNQFDKSLQHPLSKLTVESPKNKLSVPAKNSVTSVFNIKVPNDDFNGSILGSLSFTSEPSKNNSGSGNVKINNAYSYVIPVILNEGVNQQPNLKLLQADGKVINGTNNFYAHFQNDQPALMTGVHMTGAIYTKKGYDNHEKPLYKVDKKDASIAPNSNFNYLMPTNGQAFKSGDYKFVGDVNWGKHNWEYNKDFHMSFAKAYKANNEATGVKSDYTWLWILLVAILIIIALVITVITLYIKNKHNRK